MTLPQRQSHIIKNKTGPDDPELQVMLQEALSQVSAADVVSIADELSARRLALFTELQPGSPAWTASFARMATAVTHTRANARTLESYCANVKPGLFEELLYGEAQAPARVQAFVEMLDGLDTRLALELATGLLHNTSSLENWLWTRWLWDPTTGTGILPLLAGSVHNLVAASLADGYARVGSVTAMSMKFGDGTGLLVPELMDNPARAPFASSAFLACAYGVYLYGTTSWRLSREFNGLLPTLPNLARRLLGLPKVKEPAPVPSE